MPAGPSDGNLRPAKISECLPERHLVGQQDIVIKALGKSLSHVRGFVGASDLGDQSVTLVLDTAQLLEEVLASSDRSRMLEVGS